MRKSPVTVQQWVDSLPSAQSLQQPSGSNVYSPPSRNPRLMQRDISVQSDDACSYCSSVESVLEQRKPDPEAILLGLGFGPPHSTNFISRIPERFLQPSKLITQIDINKFVEQYGGTSSSPDNSAQSSPARFHPKTF